MDAVRLVFIVASACLGEGTRIGMASNEMCCCTKQLPLMKFVCIDRRDSNKNVYSPASLEIAFNSTHGPKGGGITDKAFMNQAPSPEDEEILGQSIASGKILRTIKMKRINVSYCAGDRSNPLVKMQRKLKMKKKRMDAVQLQMARLTWGEYRSYRKTFRRYTIDADVHHIVIGDVVYAETTDDVPTQDLAKCVEEVSVGNLRRKMQTTGRSKFKPYETKCETLTMCHKYINTHACGWGRKTGTLYKRIGRIGGQCMGADELRSVRLSWSGAKKCPSGYYNEIGYENNLDQTGGLRFCSCNNCD